mgnify:CR=1 FL=1
MRGVGILKKLLVTIAILFCFFVYDTYSTREGLSKIYNDLKELDSISFTANDVYTNFLGTEIIIWANSLKNDKKYILFEPFYEKYYTGRYTISGGDAQDGRIHFRPLDNKWEIVTETFETTNQVKIIIRGISFERWRLFDFIFQKADDHKKYIKLKASQ